tara:strand:- start:1302 stop:1610 length:309 start_codon:yes stop_codon:yes gene_type:complete
MILTTIFLCLSLILNIFLFIYIRWLIKNVVSTSEGFEDLFGTLEQFSTHLEQVYSLETFYGDDTLQSLLRHTKTIVEDLNKFKEAFLLTDEDMFEDEEYEEI